MTRDRFGGKKVGYWTCPICFGPAEALHEVRVVYGISPFVMATPPVLYGGYCKTCNLEQCPSIGRT